ncbi:MAG: phosphoenolpyruvate--protein phosphotransferase [Eubacteriales bacterium]|nr:phosphoenolpyruvate--protein phosphotransferase [Eubacteriales bacterium]
MQLKGVAAAPGLVMGPCYVLEEVNHPDFTRHSISESFVDEEKGKVHIALNIASEQLTAIRDRAEAAGLEEQAAVMDAHLMMLGDPILTEGFMSMIASEKLPGVGAVQKGIAAQADIFEALEDAYFRERAQDIRDIGRRLVNILLGIQEADLSALPKQLILIARDITPSMMASVDTKNLLGIVAEIGGKTSHTAILANNMSIPAVLGCHDIVNVARAQGVDALIAIDGSTGTVHLGLTDEQAATLKTESERRQAVKASLSVLKDQATMTKDGVHVQLAANVMGPGDVEKVLAVGGEGVGLYRTEFLFMDRDKAPDEEEQYHAYKTMVEGLGGKPVIIRTMDIGGDKSVDYLNIEKEENPFLGYRALRICLERDDLFLTQLRAILRAAVHGQALVMFPMVCSLDELRAAKAKVEQAKEQLKLRGEKYDESIKVGIMIEIPSAAVIADVLIKEADFFSIGSNDLTQYTLAVDRMNERISYLYNSFHPAMLRLIKSVIDPARQAGGQKFAGMCGEMAGDPRATIVLLGLGLQEFSVGPAGLLRIRKIINSVDFSFAQAVAAKALTLGTATEIESYLAEILPEDLRAYLV